MRIAFIVNDLALSGGVGVVVHHAMELAGRHGVDVTLVLARDADDPVWPYEQLDHLHVATLDEARASEFDVAISTWWETTLALFQLRAARYASFVQSLEDRFYAPGRPERLGAALTVHVPVAFITEARWIRDTLAELRPDARCLLVRNGVDKDVFPARDDVEPRIDGPLRILVEGYAGSWFKGVGDALAATREMREARHVTVVAPDRAHVDTNAVDRLLGPLTQREMARVYDETDVILKLSRVEGMYGPPLEGFHRGTTVVTTAVTGHEEYVEHGVNGLVVDWDDPRGTARALDLLAADRRLLHELRTNALATARTWPSWQQAGDMMALALRTIAREPAPDPYAHAGRLLAEVRSAVEQQRGVAREIARLERDVGKLERIRRLPGPRQYVALRRNRTFQRLERVARRALALAR